MAKKKRDTLTNKKMYGIINQIAGDGAVKIVEYLKGRKNISEFIIAEKTKLDMQTTRHILYKLNNHNIAVYIRKKDRKKGWYISYWTFDKRKVRELVDRMNKERLEKLHEQLKREETNMNNFYICNKACARLDFDRATEFEFKCPECGSLLNQQDNVRTINNIKEKIKDLSIASH